MERGRPRNFETPEDLWNEFCNYKEDVKENPRLKTLFVGKDGKQVFEPLERPLTMEGFENWCADRVGYVHQYFVNQDNSYNDFLNICSRIKKEIKQDQIEGGMVGQYNPSITQRLNGLVEKVDNTVNITQPLFPDNNE